MTSKLMSKATIESIPKKKNIILFYLKKMLFHYNCQYQSFEIDLK